MPDPYCGKTLKKTGRAYYYCKIMYEKISKHKSNFWWGKMVRCMQMHFKGINGEFYYIEILLECVLAIQFVY